jgi:transposase
MDAREIKGLEIARTSRIRKTDRGWIVPSQNGNGAYLVYNEGMMTRCNCPDCQLRDVKCKHQFAVQYFEQKVTDQEGNTTVTKAVRMTYPQNWSAYNEAQSNEIRLFDILLNGLVEGVEEPERKEGAGRPNLSQKESVFCAVQKVYSQLSQRRAATLYRNAEERKQISHAPHFNAVGKLLNKEEMTPTLNRLLAVSALPLKAVETTFVPDSSGFRTSQFGQYAVEKYGLIKKHKWVKAHVLVGAKTNVIAGAIITEENGADCPQFEPLVMEAHNNGFNIQEIPADKGYLSRDNFNIAKSIGATAYIPFKSNSTDKAKGSLIWKKMYHYFQLNREEFLEHYHQRSNVETTFDMVKMKFGDKLKSKKFIAQKNELLCKLIAHNIVVLIHEMYELGIKPQFDNLLNNRIKN